MQREALKQLEMNDCPSNVKKFQKSIGEYREQINNMREYLSNLEKAPKYTPKSSMVSFPSMIRSASRKRSNSARGSEPRSAYRYPRSCHEEDSQSERGAPQQKNITFARNSPSYRERPFTFSDRNCKPVVESFREDRHCPADISMKHGRSRLNVSGMIPAQNTDQVFKYYTAATEQPNAVKIYHPIGQKTGFVRQESPSKD